MSKELLFIFDTTLRDGAQTQGVDFSVDDKIKIASALDNLGVDYIEGGWPGANPTDTEFFQKKHSFNNAKLTSFGMTKRTGRSADNDPGLSALLNSNTPAVCIVGKSWDFHVDIALGISNEENLENIKETAKHFVKRIKSSCLMQNISLMGIKLIQIMLYHVLKQHLMKEQGGLFYVILMEEPCLMKLQK